MKNYLVALDLLTITILLNSLLRPTEIQRERDMVLKNVIYSKVVKPRALGLEKVQGLALKEVQNGSSIDSSMIIFHIIIS